MNDTQLTKSETEDGRCIYCLDIGDIPAEEAEKIVKDIMEKFKNAPSSKV